MAADIFLQMEWGATLFWKLVFCAGKLSDVMYVPPWHIVTSGGKELGRLDVSARFLGKAHPKSDKMFYGKALA